MTTTLLGISGSLTAGGSTRTLIEYAVEAAKTRYPEISTAILDLREVTLSFCDGRPLTEYTDDTPRVVERIQAADVYVIGTPIYRGSYTGALKNLLDHVPVEALMGKVAGLIANAATDHHYLSIDQELRPVLMWFNMHLLPGSVYVRGNQLQGKEIVDEQVREHLRQLGEAVIALHNSLQDNTMGPPPLSLWGRRRSS
jgi:NAD(P)H-dependent FMN reductase